MKTGARIIAAGTPCQKGPSKYKFTAETIDTILACISDALSIKLASTKHRCKISY